MRSILSRLRPVATATASTHAKMIHSGARVAQAFAPPPVLATSSMLFKIQPQPFVRAVPGDMTQLRQYTTPGSVAADGSTLSLAEERGSCTLTVPLPSVGTKVFAASPHSTVQRFTESIAREDTSIKSVEVFDYEGDSIAGSMLLAHIMPKGFQLVIDDANWVVDPTSETSSISIPDAELRAMLEELKAQLPTEKARLAEIAQLEEEATTLQAQLAPYEAAHSICESKVASTHNNRTYLALAAMSIQWGFLAQLTFVEFSWDLMEPITYFVTYGTQMAFLMYFIATNKEYDYTNITERNYSKKYRAIAQKQGLDLGEMERVAQKYADNQHRLGNLKK